MIEFIKSWCEGIIVAVFISIIIEMIVSEGNNKKYIKVVVGIYIIFVILNPILEKININFDVEKFLNMETIEVSTNLDKDIKDVYITGIENSIKNTMEENGFSVNKVEVGIDDNYENIKKIKIELCEKKLNKNEILIEPIVIGKKEIQEDNIEIKKIIAENYQTDIENIYIYK